MESSRRDDPLSAMLEALRPVPAPAFAAQLDERAAAGFPRRGGAGASRWAPLVAWVRGLTPRQVLLPSLATAFVAVALATALVATNQPETHLNMEEISSRAHLEHAPEAAGGGETLSQLNPLSGAAEAEAEAAPSAAPASGVAHRDVERSAQVVLGAEPDAVSDDAAKVYEAVHAARGVVLRSSMSEGSEAGAGGAHFVLLIPSAKLDEALGAISEIDEVLSRRDGTADITAPTVGVTERLQDSQAKIDSLLNELAASETEVERETLEAELRSARSRAAFLRAQLANLRHRASFSHVSVRIEGDGSSSSSGDWSLGDATGDAGHILAVAAGVVLIGLAILAPLALIALLAWLGRRAWVRHGRRRVLE